MYQRKSAPDYPAHIAAEILSRRPDLRTTDGDDAIRTILTWTPTLTAEDAMDIIDQATADTAAEARCDHPQMQHRRCMQCDERCTCGDDSSQDTDPDCPIHGGH